MATAAQHLRALKKALDAGDTEAADYIRAQAVAAQQEEDRAAYDPIEGMGGAERVAANFGAGLMDMWTGAQQLVGAASGADAREKAARDAALAESTTGGGLLQGAGQFAAALPAMFVPGANTVAGAALIGGATGALMPTQSDNVLGGKALGAGLGAVTGGLAQRYLPGAIDAAGRAVKAVPGALAKRGLLPQRIAQPILTRQADDIFARQVGNSGQALRKIGAHRDVPGVRPTTAQILGDNESLMIERQLRESGGDAALALSNLRTASNQARYQFLREELDKNPEAMWDAARDFAAQAKGKMRVSAKGIDPHGALIREVGRLRNSYGNPRVQATFQELQDRIRDALKSKDPLNGLHQIRMFELDDALSRLTGTDKKLSRAMAADFMKIKSAMDKKIGDGLMRSGAWKEFLEGYSERARAATQAEAGQALLGKLDTLTPTSTGDPALTSGRRLLRSAVGATDDFGNPLYSPLADDAISAVNRSIDVEMAPLAPDIRPAGSATAANLNQPTIEAMRALQPVIRPATHGAPNASSAGAITGAATILGGPAGGAAAAAGSLAANRTSHALTQRADEAALALAQRLFSLYSDPQQAVLVLRQAVQQQQIAPQVASRALEYLQRAIGPASGVMSNPVGNALLAPQSP